MFSSLTFTMSLIPNSVKLMLTSQKIKEPNSQSKMLNIPQKFRSRTKLRVSRLLSEIFKRTMESKEKAMIPMKS